MKNSVFLLLMSLGAFGLILEAHAAPEVVSKRYFKSIVLTKVWVEVPATSNAVEYSYKGKRYFIWPDSKGTIDIGARDIKFTKGSIVTVLSTREKKIEKVYKIVEDFVIKSFSLNEKSEVEFTVAKAGGGSGKGVNLEVPDYPTGKGVNLEVPDYPTGKGVNLEVPNFPADNWGYQGFPNYPTGKGASVPVQPSSTGQSTFNPPLPLLPYVPPPRTFVTDGN